MTWYEWIERRRSLLIGAMSLIGFLALLVCARRNIVSHDSFWHLQMGKDWLENGLSPWIDHYSFTFAGADIASPPVLFQAALYWLVSRFGIVTGFELLKFACYALALGMVLIYLRKIRAAALAYLVVLPLVVSLIELRGLVRPELISYSLSVVALVLYHRAGTRLSVGTMLPIALLMWLWSNYHNPVIGYVIFFGFFVDAGLSQIKRRASTREWLWWLFWGMVVLGAGFLRPGFSHPLYDTLRMSSDWLMLIQEYTSPLLYKGVAAFYALIAITACALVLSIRQRRFGYLAIIIVLISGVSTMARLVTPSGIVISCLFAHMMSESDFRSWLRHASLPVQRITAAIALALIAAPLWTTVHLAREYMAENRRSSVLFPSDVVFHMKRNDLTGNIFNEYRIGGYLIYNLSPDIKVYIDGRTDILYPPDHYRQLLSAQRSPEVFIEEVDRYDISLAILESSPNFYFLMNESGFGLDFVGSAYSLFVRQEPNFPVIGMLLGRPACWDESLVSQIEAEKITSESVLMPNSAAWPFINLVTGYAESAEPTNYLLELDSIEGWTDNEFRFAAYRALSNDLNPLAINLLNAVKQREIKDSMAAALGMIRLGDLDRAENTLKTTTERAWPYLEMADLVIMNGLLQQLRTDRKLSLISEGYLDYLDSHIHDAGINGKSYEVTVDLFCAGENWERTL